MVFKVIDGNLTSIFNKTQNIANGFNIASTSINSYANAFNRLNTQQNFDARWDTFLSGMDKASPKLATYFQDLAKQGASARASIQDMYAVLLDGNTRGIGNVKSVISAFNQVNPANQQAFAQAVGQTNAQLGIYLSNLNGAKASMAGYASSLVATTAKTIALKTASMILNGALSAVVSLIIGGAITAVTKFINAQEDARQKALELAQSHEGNIEKLQELKQEYLDIVDSTDSESKKNEELIEWKKKLIQQYGFEKQALEDVNSVRQTGIDLMNEEMVKEAEQTIADLGDTYDEAYEEMYNKSWRFSRQDQGLAFYDMSSFEEMLKKYGITIDKLSTTTVDMFGGMQTNTFSKINIDAENTTDTLEKLASALADFRSMSEDPLTKNKAELGTLINELQKEYDEVKETSDKYSTIVEQGLNAKAVKKFYTYIAKDGNRITEITEDNFETWKTGLLETAEANEPLEKALAEMADKYCPNMVDGVNNIVDSVTSLADAFEALKEALEDIINYAETYQSAMQKISAGTGLTTDEVLKLLEIDPSLYNKFVQKGDGTWSIDLGTLKMSYQTEIVDNGKDLIAEEKANWQKEYDEAKSEFNRLTKERSQLVVNDRWSSEQAYTLDQQIAEAKKIMDEAQQNIGLADFRENLLNYSDVNRIQDSVEAVKKEVDSYNDSISTLNKAIDSINEGNSLSYDEMIKLVNLYPQLQDKVIKTTKGYTFEVSALEDLKSQSYTTRNSYIDNQIAMSKTALEETKVRLTALRLELEGIASQDEYLTAVENGTIAKYSEAIQMVQILENYIDILESYKNEVYEPGKSDNSSDKSITDGLQNQIDYYEMLLEAIEIVTDKVIDGLEKEKEAIDEKISKLNDEKDALQEKNDEQQRELDLIEAKNNLDKAKKQKVFVYKEGQGLVQVQDKKAVSDAQKEYDNIQNEIKEAEIDKKIKVLEKQDEEIDKEIDGWTEYKDQFSNMGNDIKDTLTVEQAKKALGTDEKGLLSLDDKTINGICNGLATAIYNKDVEDNKENSEYVTVTLDDFLKSVGVTVTPTEFKAMASTITNNPANIVPATNTNSTVNNAQTINNKTANFNATFNIYDARDPHKIIDTVKEYFNGVLKQTINSVK